MTSTVSAVRRSKSEPAAEDRTRVLLIEDNPGDAVLIRLQLEEAGRFDLVHVGRLGDGVTRLAQEAFDVVLLDLSLPDSSGAESFDTVHGAAPDRPVVVLTGLDDDRVALDLVSAGAQDYVVKGDLDGRLLARTIRYAIERCQLRNALELERRKESDLKDRFLSHVSHELRSPLAVSYLYTTNVLDGLVGDLTTEQREHLTVACDALRAQMRLIEDLLATVRADASLIAMESTAVSVQTEIAETIHGLRTAGGVRFIDESDPDLPPAQGDPHRIRQILTNLLDNAAKFSPANGAVRVRASVSADPAFLQVDVSDEGPGIPADVRQRIFERLYCADASPGDGIRGLGLGLYLCRLLVIRHGGRIWVTSPENAGSRFSFTLPVHRLA